MIKTNILNLRIVETLSTKCVKVQSDEYYNREKNEDFRG